MTDREQAIIRELDAVLKTHNALWQDVLPVLAEYAEEQCIGEPDEAWHRRYTVAADRLREAADALRGSLT